VRSAAQEAKRLEAEEEKAVAKLEMQRLREEDRAERRRIAARRLAALEAAQGAATHTPVVGPHRVSRLSAER
jgi:hypothetical protein